MRQAVGLVLGLACAGLAACAPAVQRPHVTPAPRPVAVSAPVLAARPLVAPSVGLAPAPVVARVLLLPVVGLARGVAQMIVRRDPPILFAIAPSSGTVGASVVLTGLNFGTSQENSVVRVNGVTATATAWAPTSVTITVPTTTTGSITVTRGGLTSGGLTFTVSTGCSLADGHDHAAMAAIGCFPDATNTGVPSGTSLTAFTASSTITANGTTIDAKIFEGADCPLHIQATGVLITNSQFNCSGQAIDIDDDGEYAEASNGADFLITVKDSYISCGDAAGSHGISEAYFRMIRVHLELCENGADINQKGNWEDSFIHNLSNAGGVDEHADGSQHGCGHWEGGGGTSPCAAGFVRGARNVNYLHNTILGMADNDTENTTSAIIMNKDLDIDREILVQYNRVGGGAYTIYCNQNVTGVNIRVKDNWFWTVYPQAGDSRTTDCGDESDISGNKTFPAGTPITLN